MSLKQKPQLLYIAGINPLPFQGGGELRVYKTILSLTQFYRITVLLVAQPAELPKEIVTACEKIISFQIAPRKSLRASLFGQPYWLSEWFSHEVLLQVNQLQKTNKFPAIQIDSTQLLYVLDAIVPKQLVFFTAFDIGTVSFWRRVLEHTNLLKKLIGCLGVLQVYWYEKKYLSMASTVLAVSEVDQERIKKIFGITAEVIPNAYDLIDSFKKKESSFVRLGFIGGTSHAPNREAVKFLTSEIANSLIRDNFNFRIVLAGNIDRSLFSAKTFELPQVQLLGQVDNLADFYQNIDVLVVPLKSGSGTRIKILESLAYHTPVITTQIGAEGIHSTNVYLAETASDFNTRIKNLMKLPSSERFKTEINTNQTWKQVFESLYKLIKSKS